MCRVEARYPAEGIGRNVHSACTRDAPRAKTAQWCRTVGCGAHGIPGIVDCERTGVLGYLEWLYVFLSLVCCFSCYAMVMDVFTTIMLHTGLTMNTTGYNDNHTAFLDYDLYNCPSRFIKER